MISGKILMHKDLKYGMVTVVNDSGFIFDICKDRVSEVVTLQKWTVM